MSRKLPVIFMQAAAWLIFTGLLAACAPAGVPDQSITSTPEVTFNGQLTPFSAPTATPDITATREATPTSLPSPTPTPRTHQVKKGEDLGGIAYQYRVTVPDLMAANPKVNPNAMSVGTLLIIPPSKTQLPTASPNPSAPPPSLTPIPVETGPLRCLRDQSRGIWCFLPIRNRQSFTLEGISAVIQLAQAGTTPLTQTAFLPLDRLPPGETLPLTAYFTPQQAQVLTGPFQASSSLLTALTSADNGRYLDTQLENEKVMISADGLSATVSVDIRLKPDDAKAHRLWVVAVAYDEQGQVVGMRRWENSSGQVLQNGAVPLPVTVDLYSVSGSINKVSLMAEARP